MRSADALRIGQLSAIEPGQLCEPRFAISFADAAIPREGVISVSSASCSGPVKYAPGSPDWDSTEPTRR